MNRLVAFLAVVVLVTGCTGEETRSPSGSMSGSLSVGLARCTFDPKQQVAEIGLTGTVDGVNGDVTTFAMTSPSPKNSVGIVDDDGSIRQVFQVTTPPPQATFLIQAIQTDEPFTLEASTPHALVGQVIRSHFGTFTITDASIGRGGLGRTTLALDLRYEPSSAGQALLAAHLLVGGVVAGISTHGGDGSQIASNGPPSTHSLVFTVPRLGGDTPVTLTVRGVELLLGSSQLPPTPPEFPVSLSECTTGRVQLPGPLPPAPPGEVPLAPSSSP